MLGTIVDVTDLWQTVVAAFVAAVGITLTFSLMILGAARLAELARNERPLAAGAAGVLTAVGFLFTAAAIGLGLAVMIWG